MTTVIDMVFIGIAWKIHHVSGKKPAFYSPGASHVTDQVEVFDNKNMVTIIIMDSYTLGVHIWVMDSYTLGVHIWVMDSYTLGFVA